jgi:hypothetical protein
VDALIWAADWELQCCGEPFAVGDTVTWAASTADGNRDWLATLVGPDLVQEISYLNTRHGPHPSEGPAIISGEVLGIRAAFVKQKADPPDSTMFHPVPGSEHLKDVLRADGWEPAIGARRFMGYVVWLSDPTPA